MMFEMLFALYIIITYLSILHLIDIKLDDKHTISLLQLIVLRSIGAKGIYFPN